MFAHDRLGASTLAVGQRIEHRMVLHVREVEAPVFTGKVVTVTGGHSYLSPY